jgi:hypothetical protein
MRCKFGLKAISVGLVLMMGAAAQAAGEPNSVGEILKGNKLDWIVGEWVGTTDANEKAEAKFEFVMDGFTLSIKARVGKYEFAGLAYYVASKNTIVATGVDNRGRSFGGSWLIDGDKLLLKIEQMGRDGSINNFDRFLSKVDENTMKSVTYAITDGKRSDEPIGVLEFKRKKEANPKL